MSSRAVALVVVKFFGIYILLGCLSSLGTMLQLVLRDVPLDSPGVPGILLPVSFLIAGLAMATLLLIRTRWVVRLLFREADFEALETAPDPGPLATGLALIGAWLLVQSIPTLVSRATVFLGLILGDQQSRFQQWWHENWFDMVYFSVELLIGLLLVTRNRRLARLATQIEASPT